MFINVSNHPSGQWTEAQRRAAEALGGVDEIRSLFFGFQKHLYGSAIKQESKYEKR